MNLSIKNIKVNYGNKEVLNQLNAHFCSGNIYGIIGLNGSGKTTFYNTIQGLIKPSAGSILLNDKPLKKQDIAYLETSNFFYSYITGREYLDLFEDHESLINAFNLTQIFNLPLDELIETYSTGMKKKLAMMAMLKKNVSVYLLDEPYNGLDLESCKIVDLIIKFLKQNNKIVLISSHIIDPLMKITDALYLLKNGAFSIYNIEQYEDVEKQLFGDIESKVQKLLNS
jgi:ABC-2 type transport system ATP-binding protein